jgi:hypothetical protein
MKPASRDGWEVWSVSGSATAGYYYATNVVVGRNRVTVKLTPKGYHLCLTCKSSDACEHSKFVSDYITANGLPTEVSQ